MIAGAIVFLFIYFWLCWGREVFVAAHRLSLAAASRGSSLVVVHGLLLLQSVGSRCLGASVVMAPGPSCPKVCGIFLELGMELRCPSSVPGFEGAGGTGWGVFISHPAS